MTYKQYHKKFNPNRTNHYERYKLWCIWRTAIQLIFRREPRKRW